MRPMSKPPAKSSPPDRHERERALDASRSILVQAPAGSGKTDLLTRRFLRLLSEVDEPGEVVAITFTIAAAAEMRHRILAELEKAAVGNAPALDAAEGADEFSMAALAQCTLEHSRLRGWDLVNTPAQLRISTIDSFCRELALQKPLLSGLGGEIAIHEYPADLYRRAARRTLEEIDHGDETLSAALEALLLWRDNNWHELEDLLVEMLAGRDRWMHDFVLEREPDWDALREQLERPFANAVREGMARIGGLLDRVQDAREEALELARFACGQTERRLHLDLAELAEFPCGPFAGSVDLETARQAHVCLSELLLTNDGAFRKQVDKRLGFPADRKPEKNRILALINDLATVPELEAALCAARELPPARYTEDDWQIVRACFTVLRQAAGELQVVFAEAGAADFTEVSQTAQNVLRAEDGLPTDAALAVADGIRHLLVDEFQDTSRRQHELLRRLVAAWPEREGRTCFAVGDPMQSIYFFRDADAELFPRVRDLGLEIPNAEPLALDFVSLQANFRTAPALVDRFNEVFEEIFAVPDGSGIPFSPALPAREESADSGPGFALHLEFIPQATRGAHADPDNADEITAARDRQTAEIVELIRGHWPSIQRAREAEERGKDAKFRIAVLGRTRKALAPVAEALREAAIPFRALDLEGLGSRPEVQDALALAHALLNPEDRVAWLGVLRAPWCGLALEDLHKLTSDDEEGLLALPVPELLAERLTLLSTAGRNAAERVLEATIAARELRDALPNASLGTWLEQVWLRLGGADCVDSAARANIDLLWSCLDKLPGGERDLLGPALDAALNKLTALPDPTSSSEHGVQLMTIHKAKGLEFEVVIVPDLQARCGRTGRKLLSWLERGVPPAVDQERPDEPGEITEFLVAPIQSKGADQGTAKRWVDRVRSEREAQEDRRILYVASTRAREELHLFAQPAYKIEDDGSAALIEPKNSLLATAWPALEEEVRTRFDEWKTVATKPEPQPAEVIAIAAGADGNLIAMPQPVKATLLRRLPAGYRPAQNKSVPAVQSQAGIGAGPKSFQLYERHEGGLLSRAFGVAVHKYLEELARLRLSNEWETARTGIEKLAPNIAAQARAFGVDAAQAAEIAGDALQATLKASRDPACQWILSPHADSASEVRWVGAIEGSLRTVQVDRVFRAGAAPKMEGDDCWWVVDYKTHPGETNFNPTTALLQMREFFAPQLEAYAAVMRNLHGKDTRICAGLYYPRMLLFDWWEME
jgi:ATP-dependent helicase/nuclease subunit A